ncbi:toll-like receptor 2 [Pelobates cultripes]|uniref:Toll-like receptor 2 n=1 Tax=Pelobates cultripes TaxID=61616 RepID=A0AAD1TIJ5_PELCU|nr:toll-like receptor 2 [Pelobates cultripes]
MVEPNGSTLFICFLIVNLAEGACKIDIWKKFVDCSRLNLEQVPTDISHDVEKLDLSYNILTKIKKEDFYHLSNLRILNLSYNNISSIDNDSLNTNILLENLSLFNNSLTEMPSELLEPLKNLKVLDMSNNFYNSSTLGNVFKKLVYLKNLSFGGPMIKTILKDDFVPIQDIELERFALKTQSSLEGYEVGAFSMVNTRDIWFDIALDKYADALPLILKDLAEKSFENMRFRNLFEFTYYTESMDIFSGLKYIHVDSLTFYRGKFNEYLLYLVLNNIEKPSNISDLLLLSVDFARSPNSNKTGERIENLSLENLVIQDVTNPDILRFDWTFTWFSNIRNLHIVNVNFNFVPCDAWNHMTKLESLNITGNRLLARYLYNPTCQLSLPAIKMFNASDNTMTSLRTISLLMATWSNLSVVDLSFNNIGSINESCIWPSKITTFILHDNPLIYDISLCLPLTLEYLDMSNSQLERLNMNYFNQVNNLRVLILRNNKIKFIPTGWKSLSLEVLALEGNSFGVIDGGSFKYLPSLRNLTAGNNPYYCNCDLYAFITETLSDKNISLLDWPGSYYCYHPQNLVDTKIEYFNPGKLQCDVGLVVAISVAVTAVVVIICMMLCWKYNVPWYLRATCQIIRSKYRSKNSEDNREFVYHAFISYSYLDADWVREVLLPRLENSTPPYRLCIHERDFLPGRWIIDNIIDNIENSRKIIFVLSRSFVNSEWCNYELYFAHQRNIGHAFEDVILVVKENVSLEDLPKRFYRLRKMLKAKTYLEWPSDQKRQPFFWVQLKSILGGANQTVTGQDNLSVISETVVDRQTDPCVVSTVTNSSQTFPVS